MKRFFPLNIFNNLPKQVTLISLTVLVSTLATSAQASTFTRTSPTQAGSLVASTISEVGGVVLDLIGTNGTRVVSQTSATELFQGWQGSNNSLTIGIQTGLSSAIVDALGGGLREAAVRVTLHDGDTARGNFDFNDNFLLANGINFGNWSSVNAQNTDNVGNMTSFGFSGGGFRSNILDTGWFHITDNGILSSFFNTLSSGAITYVWQDRDRDNIQRLDFKQGVASNQINISQAPTITPSSSASVPEPSAVVGLAVFGLGGLLLKKKATSRIA